MKILYHHRTASRDGQAVHITGLTEALRERGHEVTIIAPEATRRQSFGAGGAGVALVRRRLPPALGELLELAYSVLAYRRLDAAWRRERPDVLYERYNLFLPAGVWLRERRGVPLLLEVNSPLYDERRTFGRLQLQRLARWSERRAWRGADLVLPVTGELATIVSAAGVPCERVLTIPNGIDPRRFATLPRSDDAKVALDLQDRLVLGFTGFVRDWHRLDLVIDWLAATAPRAAVLLVVGDGPARDELLAHARRRGVDAQLRLTGVVPHDQVPAHLAAFDVALQPAATPYASPLKLFEYMASGRAIVAPDQPAIREVLRDDHDALLVPPGGAALAAALDRLVADGALRARLGEAARETVVRRGFTWAHNAERVEAAAAGLLAAREALTSDRRAHSPAG